MQIDTLIVDREQRIGDNWRKRYHALVLHNQVHVNHFPYMPFPPTWPAYIPKDKLAGWFEAYVESMELNYWTGTEFEGGTLRRASRALVGALRRADGTTREMHPRHIVMATGVSGIPNLPDIPTLPQFRRHGAALQPVPGRQRLAGQARADHRLRQQRPRHRAGPALDGAQVTMVQRSSTMVVNVEPSAQLPYALYDEGPPLEDCDLITTSVPLPLAKKSHIILTEQAKQARPGHCSMGSRGGLQARLRRGRHRLAVQISHARRRLLLQRRLLRPDRQRRGRPRAVFRHRGVRRRRRADEDAAKRCPPT